jgi:leader peptidase (prepilin peptidase) / N-methyltransferase
MLAEGRRTFVGMYPPGGRDLWLDLGLLAVVVPAAAIDLDRRVIPNAVVLPGTLVAVATLALTRPQHLVEHAIAAAGAGGFLLAAALASRGGMGMGDVKLAAVMGLYLGRSVAVAMLVALVAGTLAGGIVVARRGLDAGRKATLPLGPFLAVGALVGRVAGPATLSWYFDSSP